jgi:hypothetical protein
MAVEVIDTSVVMKNSPGLHVLSPVINSSAGTARFDCSRIAFDGECQLLGQGNDNPSGWTLGIIQLQWIETNWGWYRGQSNNDGSIFIQRGRAPSRTQQACRDSERFGQIFYWNTSQGTMAARQGQPFPIKLSVHTEDQPSDEYPLAIVNSRTNKPNFLYKAQLEFHFCTVLSLLSPGNKYQHLKHLHWNVHWEAEFQPGNFANPTAAWTVKPSAGGIGNTANVGGIADGDPVDPRFASILTSPNVPNCNDLMNSASSQAFAATSPNRRDSGVWELFDVRR